MFANGHGKVRRIKEELLDYINLLPIESDERNKNQYLANALEHIKILQEMNGINHIINLHNGTTFLDLVCICDSQGTERLNNSDLLQLEKALKEAGGENQELVVERLNNLMTEIIEYSDQHKKNVRKLKVDIKNLANNPLERVFLKEKSSRIIMEGESFVHKREERWDELSKKYSIPNNEIQTITEISKEIEHELFVLKSSITGLCIIRNELNISPSQKLTNLAIHGNKSRCNII